MPRNYTNIISMRYHRDVRKKRSWVKKFERNTGISEIGIVEHAHEAISI